MNPCRNPSQLLMKNSNATTGSTSPGNNYPWNVVNANTQVNTYMNDMLTVEQVRNISQEQQTYTESACSEDTTGIVPLEDCDLNSNPATMTYIVGRAEQGAPESDMLPEVAERENRDGGCDVSGQDPPMLRENETVSPSETTTLFCGLDGCSQYFADSEKLCRHLQLAHSLPTYVVTTDFATRMEYLDFRNGCLSNEFLHKMDVDGNYTVYTCQRLLPGREMTALRLVEATRGKVSSLYDQDYEYPKKLQPRRGPFIRRGGFCPAFVLVKRDGERYNVKICDWHLHGSVIPTRALEMIGTMLLLKNIPLPVVRMIIQGQTTEFCTPMSSLDLYIRRLDLKQFECLCEFVRERYAGHVDLLKGEMGYLELTPFERNCMTEYSTQQRAVKAKYTKKVDLADGSSHVNDHHVTEEGAPLNNVQRTYESGNTQRGKKRKCSSFSNKSKRCNKK